MFITRVVVMPVLLAAVLLPVAFGDDTQNAPAMETSPRPPEGAVTYHCYAMAECHVCLNSCRHGAEGSDTDEKKAKSKAETAAMTACENHHGIGNCTLTIPGGRCYSFARPAEEFSASTNLPPGGRVEVIHRAEGPWIVELTCDCGNGGTLAVPGSGCCKAAAHAAAWKTACTFAKDVGGLRCCRCRIVQRPCCCRPCRPCR